MDTTPADDRPAPDHCAPGRHVPRQPPSDRVERLTAALRPLLAAEAAAEAGWASAAAADLEQAVWLRLLERLRTAGAPADPADWLRRTVRTEARRMRRTARREAPPPGVCPGEPAADPYEGPEPRALAALRDRKLHDAVRELPGRCAALLTALLSPRDLTYREIAGELGMSQGSLGPERSRCLGCLRRMLAVEVGVPDSRGRHWVTTLRNR